MKLIIMLLITISSSLHGEDVEYRSHFSVIETSTIIFGYKGEIIRERVGINWTCYRKFYGFKPHQVVKVDCDLFKQALHQHEVYKKCVEHPKCSALK